MRTPRLPARRRIVTTPRLFDPKQSIPLRDALEAEAKRRGLVVVDLALGGYVLRRPSPAPTSRIRNAEEAA